MFRRAWISACIVGVLAPMVVWPLWLAHGHRNKEFPPDYVPVARVTELERRARALPLHVAPARPVSRALRPARWLVLCWDGATWDLILPLVSAGRMPHLAALMAGGAYGSLLTIKPAWSPVVWTTIATGVSPARHGIIGFQKGSAGDGPPPADGAPLYDNADRRAKALWNILTEHGRTVAVVGYHATFPAEPVAGVMISNYAIRREHTYGFRAPVLDEAAEQSHLVYPSPSGSEPAPLGERRRREVGWREIRRFVRASPRDFRARVEHALAHDRAQTRWGFLLKAYLYDEFHAQAGLRHWRRSRPTVALVHFQSLDWAGHRFLYFHWPERFPDVKSGMVSDEEKRIFRPTVTAFHEYVDDWLGRFLSQRDEETGVMILSDHGMEPVPDQVMGAHDGAPPGLLVMNGPGIPAGARLEGATVYDILPTLLASLRLPVAHDLPGRVLVFSESGSPPRDVETYGPYRHPNSAAAAGLEQRVKEELRAVGYIR